MKHLICFFLILITNLGYGLSINQALQKNGTIYCTINLSDVDEDKVPVEINLNGITSNSLIYRLPKVVQGTYAISDFGRFIEKFQAFDVKGNILKVEKIDANSWEIFNAKKLHKITYLVNDTYDLNESENTNIPQFPAGTNIDPENYMLNLHGFIGYFDSLNGYDYNLEITAPDDFKYATGLQLVNSTTNTKTNQFYAARYFDVTDNPIMYGTLDIEEIIINDIKIVLSIYSPNNIYTAKELKNVILNTLISQVNYLKDFNTTSRYDIQIYFFDGKTINPESYGALEHHTSTMMVLPENTKKEQLYNDLKYFISHEFFHIITPLSVHSEDIHDFNYNNPTFSKHLWMYEGVTEYFSKLFQIDQGLISEQQFYDIIFDKIQTSKKYNDSISFSRLSENILDDAYSKNYPNVYQKGALIAACLDILIRKESNSKQSLLSLMKHLTENYGKDAPFNDDSLFNDIANMTYPSIGLFLKNHVEGNMPINYQTYFDMVGLTLKAEGLTASESVTFEEHTLRNFWLNQYTDAIAFENVNVIPMDTETILENQRVIVSDGKIVSIEPSDSDAPFQIKHIIDASGKYLIPGLSEMHYHWRDNNWPIENDFKLLIANGITTTRNMAEYDGQDHISIRERTNNNEILAPNYYTTGPYLQGNMLKTFDDVVKIVREHKLKGYDFLKIGDGDNIPKEIYLKLLEEAEKNQIAVIGHGQHQLPLEYSLRMKSIEHVEEFIYIFNNGNFKFLNNDETFLNNAAKKIKTSGVYVAPTLIIFNMILQYLDDGKFAKLKASVEGNYLSPAEFEKWLTEKNHYRADFKNNDLGGVDAFTLFNNYYEWMKKFTKILYENDVPLLTGTDTFGMVVPGFSLHKEFEFLQDVGMSPYHILKASTINSARYLNTFSMEGTISGGKNANLVLLKKNPLENIKNTATIEGVMLKGKWLDKSELNTLLKEVENSN